MKTRQHSAVAELRPPSAKPLPTEARPLWMLTESEFDERIRDAVIEALAEYESGKRADPDLLTVEEMAAKLNCSRQKLTTLRAAGVVPAVKLGDVFRFEPAAVMAALRGQGTK